MLTSPRSMPPLWRDRRPGWACSMKIRSWRAGAAAGVDNRSGKPRLEHRLAIALDRVPMVSPDEGSQKNLRIRRATCRAVSARTVLGSVRRDELALSLFRGLHIRRDVQPAFAREG